MNLDELPTIEFAFPGPLRDRLVATIRDGTKTTTSALARGYEVDNEPLPAAGQTFAVVDSTGRRIAAIELTDVRVIRLADVDLAHAVDEGEGDDTVSAWRENHEEFWNSPECRAEFGADFTVDDDTLIVAQRFRLL